MDKTLVVYGSHYGATKTYAEYIAQKLSCPCLAAESLKKGMLANCDAVVFGGGVYAGSIAGWKKAAPLIVKESPSRILLFVCGLADPAKEKTRAEARMLFEKRLPENMRGLPVFCLRGGIDYAKLGLKHRAMMAMLMKLLTQVHLLSFIHMDWAMEWVLMTMILEAGQKAQRKEISHILHLSVMADYSNQEQLLLLNQDVILFHSYMKKVI